MKYGILPFIILLCLANVLLGQGNCLRGKVVDNEKEALPFATVQVFSADSFVVGVATDLDGYFEICGLPDFGLVNLQADYTGFETLKLKGVSVNADSIVVEMNPGKISYEFWYSYFETPLNEMDNTTSGQVFTSDQIRRQPRARYDYEAKKRRQAKRKERRERRRQRKAARRTAGSD